MDSGEHEGMSLLGHRGGNWTPCFSPSLKIGQICIISRSATGCSLVFYPRLVQTRFLLGQKGDGPTLCDFSLTPAFRAVLSHVSGGEQIVARRRVAHFWRFLARKPALSGAERVGAFASA